MILLQRPSSKDILQGVIVVLWWEFTGCVLPLSLSIYIYIDRVESKSNLSDGPSRFDCLLLERLGSTPTPALIPPELLDQDPLSWFSPWQRPVCSHLLVDQWEGPLIPSDKALAWAICLWEWFPPNASWGLWGNPYPRRVGLHWTEVLPQFLHSSVQRKLWECDQKGHAHSHSVSHQLVFVRVGNKKRESAALLALR